MFDDPRLVGLFVLSCISVVMSIILFIVGRHITLKITQNDLVHLTADVTELKTDSKDLKKEISTKIQLVLKGVQRIERNQIKRDAICEERHKK